MSESLDDVKTRLSTRYLGRDGIHAIGLRRPTNQIVVYVSPPANAQELLERMRDDSGGYELIAVTTPASNLAGG